jgi:hypothetical protein
VKPGNLSEFTNMKIANDPTNEDVAELAACRLSASRADGYSDWLKVGQALHSVSDGQRMLAAWEKFSALSGKYSAGECAAKWETFNGSGKITLGSLCHWAKMDTGFIPPRRVRKDDDWIGSAFQFQAREKKNGQHNGAAIGSKTEPIKDDNAELKSRSKLPTHIGLAALFALQHMGYLRYCYQRGAWLVYDCRRWRWDESGRALAMAKSTALSVYKLAAEAAALAAKASETGNDTDAKTHAARADALSALALKAQKRENLTAMMALAQPDLAISPDDLDADPWLLNVENGTIDLRTGKLRAHQPEDYTTKICRAKFDPKATAPVFQKFLDRIFKTYPTLVEYVQRAIGYSATGLTTEQVLFFLYGSGANGKTTLLDAVQHVLGDYTGKADRDLLIASDGSPAHPTNVADLMGKRLTVAPGKPGERNERANGRPLVA